MTELETFTEDNILEKKCRYCMNDITVNEIEERLVIAPCKCKNFVHIKCFVEWQNKKTDKQWTNCEICGYEFIYKKHVNNKSFMKKLGLFILYAFFFLIIYWLPYVCYYRYDLLDPNGVKVYSRNCDEESKSCQKFQYVPLGNCSCATSNMTMENTLCYVNNGTDYCVGTDHYNFSAHRINAMLLWGPDIVVNLWTMIIFFTAYVLTKKKLFPEQDTVQVQEEVQTSTINENSMMIEKKSTGLLLSNLRKSSKVSIKMVFIIYGLMNFLLFVLKGVSIGLSENMNSYFNMLLLIRIVDFMIVIRTYMFFNRNIESHIVKIFTYFITIFFMLVIHLTGYVFIINNRHTYPELSGRGWLYPSLYSYFVGLFIFAGVVGAILFLYLLWILTVKLYNAICEYFTEYTLVNYYSVN